VADGVASVDASIEVALEFSDGVGVPDGSDRPAASVADESDEALVGSDAADVVGTVSSSSIPRFDGVANGPSGGAPTVGDGEGVDSASLAEVVDSASLVVEVVDSPCDVVVVVVASAVLEGEFDSDDVVVVGVGAFDVVIVAGTMTFTICKARVGDGTQRVNVGRAVSMECIARGNFIVNGQENPNGFSGKTLQKSSSF
jgi:hypothetical protein